MKRIALVTTSLNEEQTLKPFICALEQDPHVDLGRISWTGHSDARMDLRYLRVETDNILLDNQFHLTLDRQEKFAATSQDFNLQLIFQRALTALSPELVIVFGNSPMAFAAASAANLDLKVPVAHLNGGTKDIDILGPAYGDATTRLSTLHFTACHAYARRVKEAGAHPGLVFNVGTLESPDRQPQLNMATLARQFNWSPRQRFILVAPQADAALGSKNTIWVNQLIQTMAAPELSDFKFGIILPPPTGLNNLVRQPLEAFIRENPEQCVALPGLDTPVGHSALAHCAALVGNIPEHLETAHLQSVPHVFTGSGLCDISPLANVIRATPAPDHLIPALCRAQGPEFLIKVASHESPLIQANTPDRIKSVLIEYLYQLQSHPSR